MSLISGSTRELTNARALDIAVVDANGDQIVSFSSTPTPPSNATLSNVAVSTVSATLLAANANRKQFIIQNSSGKTLNVAFAATASTTAYSFIVANNATFISDMGCYTGDISVVANGTGTIRVTEVTV